MNLLQISEALKGVPKQFLVQEATQPSGRYPQYMVVAELSRRTGMEKQFAAAEAQMPTQTVAEQKVAEATSPMPTPMTMAMGQTQPNMPSGMIPSEPRGRETMGMPAAVRMYEGGRIKMAPGGQTSSLADSPEFIAYVLGRQRDMATPSRIYGFDKALPEPTVIGLIKKAEAAARNAGIPNDKIDTYLSLLAQESAFHPFADSGSSKGIGQVKPSTAREPGAGDYPTADKVKITDSDRIFNIDENLAFSAAYFKDSLDRVGGNTNLALAGYNAGGNKVARIVEELTVDGNPPSFKQVTDAIEAERKGKKNETETTDYVANITGLTNKYSTARPPSTEDVIAGIKKTSSSQVAPADPRVSNEELQEFYAPGIRPAPTLDLGKGEGQKQGLALLTDPNQELQRVKDKLVQEGLVGPDSSLSNVAAALDTDPELRNRMAPNIDQNTLTTTAYPNTQFLPGMGEGIANKLRPFISDEDKMKELYLKNRNLFSTDMSIPPRSVDIKQKLTTAKNVLDGLEYTTPDGKVVTSDDKLGILGGSTAFRFGPNVPGGDSRALKFDPRGLVAPGENNQSPVKEEREAEKEAIFKNILEQQRKGDPEQLEIDRVRKEALKDRGFSVSKKPGELGVDFGQGRKQETQDAGTGTGTGTGASILPALTEQFNSVIGGGRNEYLDVAGATKLLEKQREGLTNRSAKVEENLNKLNTRLERQGKTIGYEALMAAGFSLMQGGNIGSAGEKALKQYSAARRDLNKSKIAAENAQNQFDLAMDARERGDLKEARNYALQHNKAITERDKLATESMYKMTSLALKDKEIGALIAQQGVKQSNIANTNVINVLKERIRSINSDLKTELDAGKREALRAERANILQQMNFAAILPNLTIQTEDS